MRPVAPTVEATTPVLAPANRHDRELDLSWSPPLLGFGFDLAAAMHVVLGTWLGLDGARFSRSRSVVARRTFCSSDTSLERGGAPWTGSAGEVAADSLRPWLCAAVAKVARTGGRQSPIGSQCRCLCQRPRRRPNPSKWGRPARNAPNGETTAPRAPCDRGRALNGCSRAPQAAAALQSAHGNRATAPEIRRIEKSCLRSEGGRFSRREPFRRLGSTARLPPLSRRDQRPIE